MHLMRTPSLCLGGRWLCRDDSFNSSAKSLSRRDRLLDSLLLRSGGNLRHFLGASGSEDLGDDVAVSVPRCNYLFPPGCKRRRDGDRLLGQSVVSLVRDPYTCRMAVLEPRLGVPFIFEELFAFLRGRLDVPQVGGSTTRASLGGPPWTEIDPRP